MQRSCAFLAPLLLLWALQHQPAAVAAQEVISIGGFVTVSKQLSAAIAAQSQSDPDLQAVHIQLYSPAGVKVAEGDCSPNGYYFVPVDKPGSYAVRVHGPQGWVFEPQQLSISCDSSSCNSGQDVNFEVSGVELSGHLQPGPVASTCKANTPPSFAGAWCSVGSVQCLGTSTLVKPPSCAGACGSKQDQGRRQGVLLFFNPPCCPLHKLHSSQCQ
jgi:hypothetical protein